MKLRFTKNFIVPKSEVTPCGALKPFHMLNALQDAADGAVEDINPPEEYWTCGCGWMLVKYSIRFDRPWAIDDPITINTGHRYVRDLYSARRFVVYDGLENQIGIADSLWVYVDLQKRRPLRLSRRLPDVFTTSQETEDTFEPAFSDPLPPERIDRSVNLHVRLSEIDMNGHVNNAYYVSWAAESLPKDVYLSCGLYAAEILYKHEATYGMFLTVETQQDGLDFRHRITNSDGKEIAILTTKWAKVDKL